MNIRRIALATDFSPASVKSYFVAAALAKKTKSEVILVHVDERVEYGFHDVSELDEYLNHITSVRDRHMAHAQDMFSRYGVTLSCELVQGVAWEKILEITRQKNADILVIARNGARGLERVVLGSTTTRVLRNSDFPTVIVPGAADDISDEPLTKIMVSTDFSEESAHGVQVASELANLLGAKLTVVHVLCLPTLVPAIPGESLFAIPRDFSNRMQQDVAKQLDEVVAKCSSADVQSQVLVDFGVAEALAAESEKEADLIVVPSHGKGGMGAVFLGSTAEELVKISSKPVLVLPKGCFYPSEDD